MAASLLDRVDPVGASLGAAGLLGQAVSLCVGAFDLWSRSEELGPEATLFQIKLDLQSGLLRAWEEHWGVARQQHLSSPLFRGQNGDIAVNTVTAIHELVASLDPVSNRFPQLNTAPNTAAASLARLHLLNDATSQENLNYQNRQLDLSGQTSRVEKFRWALQKDSVDKTLENIEILIRGLFRLFPPPRYDPSTAAIFNPTLTSGNTVKLDTLSNIDASSFQSTLAGLKSLSRALDARLYEADIRDRELIIPYRSLRFIKQDEDGLRSTADYRPKGGPSHDVFIEWKPIMANLRGVKALTMARRVDNVARLLRREGKPAELRTTDCLGYCEKIDSNTNESFVGYVFTFPAPGGPWSLHQVISLTESPPAKSSRLQLAYTLTKALSLLHLSSWLHKSVRSHNILFFAESIIKVDLEQCGPYLAGFDFSRADEIEAMTEIPDAVWEFDLYRHPDCQGLPIEPITQSGDDAPNRTPFSKYFDIYSMGVVLLEIGLWRKIADIKRSALQNPKYSEDKPIKFLEWITLEEAPKLKDEMGQAFMVATIKCLMGDFGIAQPAEVAFYLEVILQLRDPVTP